MLSATEHYCIMEATGNYGFILLYLLHQSGVAVSLVNPKQIRHFIQTMMAITKTDEKDICDRHVQGEDTPSSLQKSHRRLAILLKQNKVIIRRLHKQLIASKNLRELLVMLLYRDKICRWTLDKTIVFLTRQIE
ncbi:Uncharacterised protein [Alistipes sp. cv1]|jgi:IS110 family transposase|uniref:IS110 family transposase n=1 Tax=Alistipes putredinis TaxID=28117 RepID=UPI0006C04472|nr:Uncharacterised protein [Faecalibacterium prausnitzii]